MSRIGKLPVKVPSGVSIKLEDQTLFVKGPKGELSRTFPNQIRIKVDGEQIAVEKVSDTREQQALHGLVRSLIANMVEGVSSGFNKTLEIGGVGYRAAKKGKGLEVSVGYSKPVVVEPVNGIDFDVPIPTRIVVTGCDKQLVGKVAAEIRAIRPPEPYKGKGIRYMNEHIRRKVGKTAK
jgi:large subunit ribosomal protein L6